MSKEARYVAVCVAVSVFVLAYVLYPTLGLPTLLYYPLEHRWSFVREPGLAMAWYGRGIGASALAAAAFAVARAVVRMPGPRALRTASAALLASLVLAISILVVAV